jgi:hypothetical protein
MKLLTFRPPRARSGHFGVLLSGERVLDITALAGRKLPATLHDCIRIGERSLAEVKATVETVEARSSAVRPCRRCLALASRASRPRSSPGKSWRSARIMRITRLRGGSSSTAASPASSSSLARSVPTRLNGAQGRRGPKPFDL